MKDPKPLRRQRTAHVEDPQEVGAPDRLPRVGGDPEALGPAGDSDTPAPAPAGAGQGRD